MAANAVVGRAARPGEAADRLSAYWAAVADARRAAGIRAARAAVSRPPGGFSISEYAIQFGLPRQKAARELETMLDNGSVVEHSVMLPDRMGRLVVTRVFVPQPLAKVAGGKAVSHGSPRNGQSKRRVRGVG